MLQSNLPGVLVAPQDKRNSDLQLPFASVDVSLGIGHEFADGPGYIIIMLNLEAIQCYLLEDDFLESSLVSLSQGVGPSGHFARGMNDGDIVTLFYIYRSTSYFLT